MIRSAVPDDVDRIYEIYCQQFNQTVDEHCKYGPNSFSLYVDSHHAEVLVYVHHGVVVGFILTFDMVDWGFIEIISVDREYRRKGIGTALVQHVIDHPKRPWFVIESCYNLTDEGMEDFFRNSGWAASSQRTEWVFKLPGR